ncbi:MAG: oxidoreductase [Bacteroidetes bacterium]|nr:oxidoreductase [Bacteroidota bacterium]MDF2451190.1 oxidoreductase [Bacteroidota bacterium]
MVKQLKIVIVGTGNVAYHIAESFQSKSNTRLIQVFNHRNSKEAKLFSKKFGCELATNYTSINHSADVYIIAVKDNAIVEVVKNLASVNIKGIVVHTSGSMDMKILQPASPNIGVYYPLQTFYIGAEIDWQNTPVLIEGNSKKTLTALIQLGSQVSGLIKKVDSQKRLQIHLAAVFACNFTNALYVSAYELIEKNLGKKDTALLLPIMQHSFQKLEKVHPKNAQTGPAMRHDHTVMKKHLTLLKSNKQFTDVYKTLSALIISQHSK